MTMPTKVDTFSVRLPADIRRQVDDIARITKRSRSFIVKEAVSSYVAAREDYINQLDEAVKSAESGIGHSGEQTFSWMETWGTENEIASPEPDIIPKS
jgi:predicted transcriptional regulator